MNKRKIFTIIAVIGFWGSMIHPVMMIPFAFGVWGLNKCGENG